MKQKSNVRAMQKKSKLSSQLTRLFQIYCEGGGKKLEKLVGEPYNHPVWHLPYAEGMIGIWKLKR